eukprot:CAMPEP_0202481940 /NCGR_PEP_ID=MMETSP1361-20130828/1404_1 /ASSEMBLY_ACC=CAM_ASM_000849 /TAXON_ID=210615 /ORGANISM="Staurosira complex sp., Strain CCMP2646" /LENGTH=244 /DNA_ID=CAMNT_0049109605 /DNA_START=35 /DNA_END=766 /DNA_ORIENTATION=+
MMSTTAALSSLTRRLAHISLVQNSSVVTSFKALGAQQWRFKNSGAGKGKGNKKESSSNLQHLEWVKFQQSIAVDGFETGQTTKATVTALTGRKDRGGKQLRKRKEKEMAEQLKSERLTESLGGGLFPPMSFSEEDTRRLLSEAYANIPKRAGKRGTNNLKRQRVRWFRVRKIRTKQKKFKERAHFRKMGKRSHIVKQVLEMKESAKEIRAKEKAYQDAVFRKWTQQMLVQEETENVAEIQSNNR